MPVFKTHCLRCGGNFVPARTPAAFCQLCYADAPYLKPVVRTIRPPGAATGTAGAAARAIDGDKGATRP
jgi:hypothetical protein